jgi:hypothetical protein
MAQALPSEYSSLLDSYVRDLHLARDEALRRQEGRLRTWTKRLGSEARAQEKLAEGRPPSGDLRVVAVVRKYWLACEALNRREGRRVVEPREFLLDVLRDRAPQLATFIDTLPYWPIGVDDYNHAPGSVQVRSTSHTELFESYVQELRETFAAVGRDYGIESLNARKVTRDEARRVSTDPRVISVYRKYFLACDRLNREGDGREQISPIVFTTEMLMGSHDDLFDVIVELPYSPVGLDENDRYV